MKLLNPKKYHGVFQKYDWQMFVEHMKTKGAKSYQALMKRLSEEGLTFTLKNLFKVLPLYEYENFKWEIKCGGSFLMSDSDRCGEMPVFWNGAPFWDDGYEAEYTDPLYAALLGCFETYRRQEYADCNNPLNQLKWPLRGDEELDWDKLLAQLNTNKALLGKWPGIVMAMKYLAKNTGVMIMDKSGWDVSQWNDSNVQWCDCTQLLNEESAADNVRRELSVFQGLPQRRAQELINDLCALKHCVQRQGKSVLTVRSAA